MPEITFPQTEARNLGRHGFSYSCGLHISSRQDCIAFQPINSKGNLTAARIVVPKTHLPALLETLAELMNGRPTHEALTAMRREIEDVIARTDVEVRD